LKGEITYYKILGVSEDASNHELRKAFCKLSMELHPDTTSLDSEEAKNKFQKVLEAYENLNNSNLRKIYDEKLFSNSKKTNSKKTNKNNSNVFNTLVMDSSSFELEGNRRPFSNGEMFSLFLLISIIFISLLFAILIAFFTGRGMESVPIWLLR